MLRIVGQVGIFMICAQAVLHFKPAESYGKYIRLLISLMVLVQLIVPVLEIFGASGKAAFSGRVAFYDEELVKHMEEVNITSVSAEKLLEKLTLEEIKTRINNEESQEAEQDAEETWDVSGGSTKEDGAEAGAIEIDRIEVSAGD